VKGLRSFIGAYKVLARVIPGCAGLLAPLDSIQAGQVSQDHIQWTDSNRAAFTKAQTSLGSCKTITLPRREDQVWIVTDGAVKNHGIGSTMYVTRDDKPILAGFFSAKLRERQFTWLPCEVEALSIAVAIKHFSPYIIQSSHKACILTDSKPCVQAFEKLCRGEFSSSPRVSTFLSAVSRYQASIRHLAGTANIPSDFASRNPPTCNDPVCQICNFVQRTEESVVMNLSVKDIMSGSHKLPFTSHPAWHTIQSECQDLRRVHSHLKQGTRPSKKQTDIKDVKRYLNAVTMPKNGLLVVRREEQMSPTRECIVVPRQVLDGLLTALHIQLNHPTSHQLKLVTSRYFYALDLDKAIQRTTEGCFQCASLQHVPHCLTEQTTTAPPEIIGSNFAADVLRRERQYILVLRECVTSFSCSVIIENERRESLREALIHMTAELRPLDGPPAVIRVDPAPGFVSLVNDELLRDNRICLEIGRTKNINKNPVAERAVQELEHELLKLQPVGGAVTPLVLSMATAQLNTKIRSRGLSSREMWTQRDQFSNQQLPVSDRDLILDQHHQRSLNHTSSEISKAPSQKRRPVPCIEIGDLVYVHTDRNKSRGRDRYLVVGVDGPWCNIQKFVGSQLRNTSYRVKKAECYMVPSQVSTSTQRKHPTIEDETDRMEPDVPNLSDTPSDLDVSHQPTQWLPDIPDELSTPGDTMDIGPQSGPPADVLQPNVNPTSDADIPDEEPPVLPQPARQSGRERRPHPKYDDYVMDF
jgi:hypothetical protein